MAQTFEAPLVLSPVVDPSSELVVQMTVDDREGIVIKDRTAP